jgi:hypothetical protein
MNANLHLALTWLAWLVLMQILVNSVMDSLALLTMTVHQTLVTMDSAVHALVPLLGYSVMEMLALVVTLNA